MQKYELEYIADITTNSNPIKILSKNKKIKKLFDLELVEVEEYIDKKGKLINKYSSVYYNNVYYKVNKPYKELINIIQNRSIPILGFAYKSKKYK